MGSRRLRPSAHPPSVQELRDNLIDARTRTLDLIGDLADDQLMGPHLPIINPFLWEIGHIAWFQEHWVMRHQGGEDLSRADADSLYDSMAIPHETRWDLPLPGRQDTLDYMERSLERVLSRLQADPHPDLAYFVQLVTFHEDMHDEAFTYTRQTLGYPAPRLRLGGESVAERQHLAAGSTCEGDIEVQGGAFVLGADPQDPSFVFDNEKWGHAVEVAPFRMARTAVTNAEVASFADDRGYEREELWSPEGWEWKQKADAHHPVYWRRSAPGAWQRREFDRWVPLGERLPIIHVNWFEADAFCRWAGRRLPTEPEREAAAAGVPGEKRRYPWGEDAPSPAHANLDGRNLGVVDAGALPEGDTVEGCRQLIGNAWEWTSTPFGPYAGFVPDPYKEYSEPWFDGNHMVLRGGAWATRGRMLRNTWRDFYTRDRRDVFAGFRTCALR